MNFKATPVSRRRAPQLALSALQSSGIFARSACAPNWSLLAKRRGKFWKNSRSRAARSIPRLSLTTGSPVSLLLPTSNKQHYMKMELKLIQRGRYRGRIDIAGSMDTLAVGESWRMVEQRFSLGTVRNVASAETSSGDKVFRVIAPGLSEPYITIKRIR